MNKTVLYIIGGVVLVLIIGGVVFAMQSQRVRDVPTDITQTTQQASQETTQATPTQQTQKTSSVRWEYSDAWKTVGGTAPECVEPVVMKSPVDLAKATAILYPGQPRGGNYKPHGGFRFDGVKNEDITVTAPYDGEVVSASRYIEMGEVQYLFDVINACGIRYRFDHLLTLSPKFADIANQLPEAKVDDSRTTNINPPVAVKTGEAIATAVGFAKTGNVAVDWGVYDLRKSNGVTKDFPELSAHAVCWFDWLSTADEATVRSLPAGDPQSGKTSDYCK